jgi:nucleotide-binding universal stress UspA family protein
MAKPESSPRSVAPFAAAEPIRRILVPLDGSRLAEAALPIAARLAQVTGATISLLHVIEQDAPSTVHGERHLDDTTEAEAYLDELARELRSAGRVVDLHVHEVPVGNVARSIADHADEERSDLIVISTHGSGGLRRTLWGSIAQRVLQLSHRPVLFVRSQSGATTAQEPFTPATIMVPLDGTLPSEAALPLAVTLARALDAQLRLVLVVPTLETVTREEQPQATFLPGTTRILLQAQQEQAAAYLEDLATRLQSTGVACLPEVRRGAPLSELAADTAEHADGLVIAASHGRAGLQSIWSTSVASRLLRRTDAPVLLVPIVE